eukprot:365602-Chlamydomonas_euryale.AAC.12
MVAGWLAADWSTACWPATRGGERRPGGGVDASSGSSSPESVSRLRCRRGATSGALLPASLATELMPKPPAEAPAKPKASCKCSFSAIAVLCSASCTIAAMPSRWPSIKLLMYFLRWYWLVARLAAVTAATAVRRRGTTRRRQAARPPRCRTLRLTSGAEALHRLRHDDQELVPTNVACLVLKTCHSCTVVGTLQAAKEQGRLQPWPRKGRVKV